MNTTIEENNENIKSVCFILAKLSITKKVGIKIPTRQRILNIVVCR